LSGARGQPWGLTRGSERPVTARCGTATRIDVLASHRVTRRCHIQGLSSGFVPIEAASQRPVSDGHRRRDRQVTQVHSLCHACAANVPVPVPCPKTPPPLGVMIRLVAQLGGYVNRPNRPEPPGPQTVWLGLQRIHDLTWAWITFGPESHTALPPVEDI
jgi:hypothetical protein